MLGAGFHPLQTHPMCSPGSRPDQLDRKLVTKDHSSSWLIQNKFYSDGHHQTHTNPGWEHRIQQLLLGCAPGVAPEAPRLAVERRSLPPLLGALQFPQRSSPQEWVVWDKPQSCCTQDLRGTQYQQKATPHPFPASAGCFLNQAGSLLKELTWWPRGP